MWSLVTDSPLEQQTCWLLCFWTKKWLSSLNINILPSSSVQLLSSYSVQECRFFFIMSVSSCFFAGPLAGRSFPSNLFLTMEALMFTPASPNDCFSEKLVFLGYFLLSLISTASLPGDFLRFLPHFLFRCGLDILRV